MSTKKNDGSKSLEHTGLRGGKTDLRIGTRRRGERLNKRMRVNSEPQEIAPDVLHENSVRLVSGHSGDTRPGQTRKKPKDLSAREREEGGCGEGGGLYAVYT